MSKDKKNEENILVLRETEFVFFTRWVPVPVVAIDLACILVWSITFVRYMVGIPFYFLKHSKEGELFYTIVFGRVCEQNHSHIAIELRFLINCSKIHVIIPLGNMRSKSITHNLSKFYQKKP